MTKLKNNTKFPAPDSYCLFFYFILNAKRNCFIEAGTLFIHAHAGSSYILVFLPLSRHREKERLRREATAVS